VATEFDYELHCRLLAFQRAHGIPSNGLVCTETWRKLVEGAGGVVKPVSTNSGKSVEEETHDQEADKHREADDQVLADLGTTRQQVIDWATISHGDFVEKYGIRGWWDFPTSAVRQLPHDLIYRVLPLQDTTLYQQESGRVATNADEAGNLAREYTPPETATGGVVRGGLLLGGASRETAENAGKLADGVSTLGTVAAARLAQKAGRGGENPSTPERVQLPVISQPPPSPGNVGATASTARTATAAGEAPTKTGTGTTAAPREPVTGNTATSPAAVSKPSAKSPPKPSENSPAKPAGGVTVLPTENGTVVPAQEPAPTPAAKKAPAPVIPPGMSLHEIREPYTRNQYYPTASTPVAKQPGVDLVNGNITQTRNTNGANIIESIAGGTWIQIKRLQDIADGPIEKRVRQNVDDACAKFEPSVKKGVSSRSATIIVDGQKASHTTRLTNPADLLVHVEVPNFNQLSTGERQQLQSAAQAQLDLWKSPDGTYEGLPIAVTVVEAPPDPPATE
jgi:hypothetical protein